MPTLPPDVRARSFTVPSATPRWRLAAALVVLITLPAPARAPVGSPTDEDVDRAVTELIAYLREAQDATPGPAYGSFRGERADVHAGGVTALATYALLVAGVPWHDETIHRAVDYLAEHPLPGTYSRSLRAAVWTHLTRQTVEPRLARRYRKLLQDDVSWLVRTLKPDGFHGYDAEGTGGDHSCSQFGVLGVWIGESAAAEVPQAHWEKVARHWLTHQAEDGSWSYQGRQGGSVTMTTAGVNTLYVILSQDFARREPAYQLWRGVPPRGTLQARIDEAIQAAERGFAWLAERNILTGGGYQLFGLERLGVASGRKFVGETDWYRAGVGGARRPPGDTIEAAFRLLFLTYGRAPVLINKLQYQAVRPPGWRASESPDWNRYYRDLHFLTSWLSQQHECIYKWQVVPVEAELRELQDAPLLLISGSGTLTLTPTQLNRLRDYLDAGGTIIGHADRADAGFSEAFRRTFEQLLAERGRTFAPLGPEHPIFRAHHKRAEPWPKELRLEGLDDGLRTCVLLFGVDVAGAWHQNLAKRHPELFEIMGNLRVYAAPGYDDLPKRLRADPAGQAATPPRGYLTITSALPNRTSATPLPPRGRGQGEGAEGDSVPSSNWRPWRWHAFAGRFAAETGVLLALVPPSVSADPAAGGSPASPEPPADLLVLSGPQPLDLSPAEVDSLAERLRRGSMLLLENAGGQAAFVPPAQATLQRLAVALDGQVAPLPADHPILKGELPGGVALPRLKPSRWAPAAMRADWPPLEAVFKNGRPVALLVPFDLVATAGGHYLYEAAAYQPAAASALLRNVLLWRYLQVTAAGTSGRHDKTAAGLPTRDGSLLLRCAQAALDAGDDVRCAHLLSVILTLEPQLGPAVELRERLLARLVEQARRATAEKDPFAARALLAIAERLGVTSLDIQSLVTQASESLAAASPEVPALPPELADIKVTFRDEPSDALALLTQWFDADRRQQVEQQELRNLYAQVHALEERARQLQQERRGGSGAAGRRSTPDAEARQIARERHDLNAKLSATLSTLEELETLLAEITGVLTPFADALAAHGVVLRDGRWETGAE